MIDFIASVDKLYERHMAPVSASFSLTAVELSILLFLANNPEYDTAKEIVEKRHLTKSHVSVSLRDLEERGFLKKEHRNGDNRTVHLVLLPASDAAIREGRQAQADFVSILTDGLSSEQRDVLQNCFLHMKENILEALKKQR